jgi:hypothetical protein
MTAEPELKLAAPGLTVNEALVGPWLDQGGRRFVLVSDSYFYKVGEDSWTMVDNAFARDQLGAAGTRYLSYSNAATVRSFTSASFSVPYGFSYYYVSYLNPRPGVQVLFTEATPDSGLPVVTRYVTDAGSTVVYSGFGLAEVRNPDAGGKQRDVVRALLQASGIR